MAKPCCSIETEPRTLNEGQLILAREVAVDIVQKKESNEASCIFTEGLKPVAAIKEMAQIVQKEDTQREEKADIAETSCQCLCSNSAIIETPDQVKLKEPLSAPF